MVRRSCAWERSALGAQGDACALQAPTGGYVPMNRRSFLRLTSAAAAGLALPLPRLGQALAASLDTNWRVFEVTTHVELLHPKGVSRAWVPLPLAVDTDFQKSLGNTWDAKGGRTSFEHDPRYGVTFVSSEWADGVRPILEVTSKVTLRNWLVNLTARPGRQTLDGASRALWTAPTRLIPTDGLVLATAKKVTEGVSGGDVERARAIYNWVCDNSYRDPKARGCGLGDVNSMLATQTLGGKCADINGLFIGLARAVGIPARDVYGIRVAARLQGPRQERGHHQGPTLPSGILRRRLRVDSGGPRRRPKSHPRRASGEPRSHGLQSVGRPRRPLRRLGDELDGLQLRP
jgi:Transglutaminase-like superfamily